MKNPVIVFDLGGVLVDWNPRYLFRKIFSGDETKTEWFLSKICTGEWNATLDTGVSFEEHARQLTERFPEYRSEIQAWHDRWEEMFNGPIHGTLEIFNELKKSGHRIYALTNWSRQTWPRGMKLFPFFREFDGHVVSGQEGFKKPDRRIFEVLLARYDLKPKDCLFIDDVPANVEAAGKLGMIAIQFRTPESLREELRKFSLLPAAQL